MVEVRRSAVDRVPRRHRRARPAYLGTGTVEPEGSTLQALEIIRGCWGLDLVGCDLVEVAPIYDVSGMTRGASDLLYEMLCVLPGVERRRMAVSRK